MARRKTAPVKRRRPLKERLCRLVVRLFLWLYLFALALTAISLLDLFGFSPRPLAGVMLIILGLPWTLGSALFPEDLQPVAALLAPTINWIILGFLCAWQRLKPTLPHEEET